MHIIKGEKIAEDILGELAQKMDALEVKPGLAVILVGDDEASRLYVNLKEKASRKIGINFYKFEFENGENSEDVEKKVIQKIQNLNSDNEVDGIIVQLPLPGSIDAQKVINNINPSKDVDGFHPESVNLFFEDREYFWPVFPKAIMKLVESIEINLLNKSGCVIANSERFGEVMVKAMNKKGMEAEYVLTRDLGNNIAKTMKADVLVTACGVPQIITGEMVKEGVVIIDGGISKEGKKILGDVDFDSVKDKAAFISPVPGGVGPVTVASLMENVYLASRL